MERPGRLSAPRPFPRLADRFRRHFGEAAPVWLFLAGQAGARHGEPVMMEDLYRRLELLPPLPGVEL